MARPGARMLPRARASGASALHLRPRSAACCTGPPPARGTRCVPTLRSHPPPPSAARWDSDSRAASLCRPGWLCLWYPLRVPVHPLPPSSLFPLFLFSYSRAQVGRRYLWGGFRIPALTARRQCPKVLARRGRGTMWGLAMLSCGGVGAKPTGYLANTHDKRPDAQWDCPSATGSAA